MYVPLAICAAVAVGFPVEAPLLISFMCSMMISNHVAAATVSSLDLAAEDSV